MDCICGSGSWCLIEHDFVSQALEDTLNEDDEFE